MGADADEADLALLLGELLGLDVIVVNVGGIAAAVQIPDVDVVGIELTQALIEMLHHAGFVGRVGLGGKDDLLAFGAERCADHALVVAVLIATRGVEVIDTEVGGARNDAGVGGDHAAKADGGDAEAGVAERLVAELDGGVGERIAGVRLEDAEGGRCAGKRSE